MNILACLNIFILTFEYCLSRLPQRLMCRPNIREILKIWPSFLININRVSETQLQVSVVQAGRLGLSLFPPPLQPDTP